MSIFQEAGSRDLVEQQAHRIDQELVLRPRHTRRDVAEDQISHAEMGNQPIAGGEIDPHRPLCRIDIARLRRKPRFKRVHGCFSFKLNGIGHSGMPKGQTRKP
jgi:hypothetical protein